MALVSLTHPTAKSSFIEIFHNELFPSYSDLAPCCVIPLRTVIFLEGKDTKGIELNNTKCNDTELITQIEVVDKNLDFKYSPSLSSPALGGASIYSSERCLKFLKEINSISNHRRKLGGLPSLIAEAEAQISTQMKTMEPTPTYFPTCPICIRRIRGMNQIYSNDKVRHINVSMSFSFSTKLLLTQKNNGNMIRYFSRERQYHHEDENEEHLKKSEVEIEKCKTTHFGCIVCELHHWSAEESEHCHDVLPSQFLATSNKDEERSSLAELAACYYCGSEGVVWICMICGLGGCGRYSSKHSLAHYNETGHNISIQIGSGKIWNYYLDRFIHIEDSNSIVRQFQLQQTVNNLADGINDDTNIGVNKKNISESNSNSDVILGNKHFLYLGTKAAFYHNIMSKNYSKSDLPSTGKFKNVIHEYENQLQLQLMEQQLYYEKLLARETVKVLETFYTNKSKKKTNQNIHSSITEDVTNDNDGSLEQTMQDIENLKILISTMEADYKVVLESIKDEEGEVRKMKKQNDKLIQQIKVYKEKEQALQQKEKTITAQREEQILELDHQIQDLKFFAKAQNSVKKSPLKDDIEMGSVSLEPPKFDISQMLFFNQPKKDEK